MSNAVSKLIRVASVVICLIAAVSFLLFAVDQTSTASGHQQEELAGTTTTPAATGAGGQTTSASDAKENGVREALDQATEDFSAPVSSLTSSSEWGSRGLRLIFVLLVYGFGLGYLARVLRVRV